MAAGAERAGRKGEAAQTFRERLLAEGDGVRVDEYWMAPGASFAEHTHPSSHMAIVLRGAGISRVLDEEFRLRGGQSFYVAGNVRHSFVADPEVGATVLNIVYEYGDPGLLESVLNSLPASRDGSPPRPGRGR